MSSAPQRKITIGMTPELKVVTDQLMVSKSQDTLEAQLGITPPKAPDLREIVIKALMMHQMLTEIRSNSRNEQPLKLPDGSRLSLAEIDNRVESARHLLLASPVEDCTVDVPLLIVEHVEGGRVMADDELGAYCTTSLLEYLTVRALMDQGAGFIPPTE